jgi:hypothetical protein
METDGSYDVAGFADDTIFKSKAKTIDELEITINNALNKLCDWAECSKLTFNASKTKLVLFTKNIKYRKPDIFLQTHKLEISPSFKYLGVFFDSKLNWRTHCRYIRSKANSIINNLLKINLG